MKNSNSVSKILLQCSIILIGLAVLAVSCKKEEQVLREVKIGALLPLTGSGSSTGESMKAALELSTIQINKSQQEQGSLMRIKLYLEDTRTDTAEAKTKLLNLYNQGIRMVIGPYSSSELASLRSFADQNGVLLLSPSSVAENLAIPGDNIYRNVPGDSYQAEAILAMWNYNAIDIVVPVIRNDVWGNDLHRIVKQGFEAAGGIMADPVLYSSSVSDFTEITHELDSIVSVMKNTHPGSSVAVFMASFGEGVKILNSAAAYSHFGGVTWFGSSAFAMNSGLILDQTAALFAAEHGFCCPVFGLDPMYESAWGPVRNELLNTLGRAPEVYALTAYDGLKLAMHSYQAAGLTASFPLLKSAFEVEASTLMGITGPLVFNAAGDRAFAIYDFWEIANAGNVYSWTLSARYNNQTNVLVNF